MPVNANTTLPASEAVRCTPSVKILEIPSKPDPLLYWTDDGLPLAAFERDRAVFN